MTSQRKIAANRANAQKSSGPRTRNGKARASRNALRHGLGALVHRDPLFVGKAKAMAETICGENANPRLFELAIVIAESSLLLNLVRTQKLALIDRLRDPELIALRKRDNSFALAKARIKKLDSEIAEFQLIEERLTKLSKEQIEKQLDEIDKENSGKLESASLPVRTDERSELDAMREAISDLDKPMRYERRALSRQRRAIREFMRIKSTNKTNNPD